MVVAARAVEEAPATQDATVCEVEPEVGGEVTPLAFPARGGDTLTVVQLQQVFCVPADERIRVSLLCLAVVSLFQSAHDR